MIKTHKTVMVWLILFSIVLKTHETGENSPNDRENEQNVTTEKSKSESSMTNKSPSLFSQAIMAANAHTLLNKYLESLNNCEKPLKGCFSFANISRDFSKKEINKMKAFLGCSQPSSNGLFIIPKFEFNNETLQLLLSLQPQLTTFVNEIEQLIDNLTLQKRNIPEPKEIIEALYHFSRLLFVVSHDFFLIVSRILKEQFSGIFFLIRSILISLVRIEKLLVALEQNLYSLRHIFIRLDKTKSYFNESEQITKFADFCQSSNRTREQALNKRIEPLKDKNEQFRLLPFRTIHNLTDEQFKQEMKSRIEQRKKYMARNKRFRDKKAAVLAEEQMKQMIEVEKETFGNTAQKEMEIHHLTDSEEEIESSSKFHVEQEQEKPKRKRKNEVVNPFEHKKIRSELVEEQPLEFIEIENPETVATFKRKEHNKNNKGIDEESSKVTLNQVETESKKYFIIKAIQDNHHQYLLRLIETFSKWIKKFLKCVFECKKNTLEKEMERLIRQIEIYLRQIKINELANELKILQETEIKTKIQENEVIEKLINIIKEQIIKIIGLSSELFNYKRRFYEKILELKEKKETLEKEDEVKNFLQELHLQREEEKKEEEVISFLKNKELQNSEQEKLKENEVITFLSQLKSEKSELRQKRNDKDESKKDPK